MRSYLNENKAKNLQNGNIHVAQIPDFEISREPSGAMRSVMVFFSFFVLLHLSFTFFQPEFPFEINETEKFLVNFQLLL